METPSILLEGWDQKPSLDELVALALCLTSFNPDTRRIRRYDAGVSPRMISRVRSKCDHLAGNIHTMDTVRACIAKRVSPETFDELKRFIEANPGIRNQLREDYDTGLEGANKRFNPSIRWDRVHPQDKIL